MNWINNLDELRSDLERRVTAYFVDLRRLVVGQDGSLDHQLARIGSIRSAVYEATNQLQHEYLLVRALEWLVANGAAHEVDRWGWHPAAGGPITEPDLLGVDARGVALISAEATTSLRPEGVIDTRMAHTLAKLATMEGRSFYFVATDPMARRARTKVQRAGYSIEVVALPIVLS